MLRSAEALSSPRPGSQLTWNCTGWRSAAAAEMAPDGLRDSKYHIVGDLDELLPQPATGPYVRPSDLAADDLLDAALHAAAALADHQYQERHPARQQRRRPRTLRQGAQLSQLEWIMLNGPGRVMGCSRRLGAGSWWRGGG